MPHLNHSLLPSPKSNCYLDFIEISSLHFFMVIPLNSPLIFFFFSPYNLSAERPRSFNLDLVEFRFMDQFKLFLWSLCFLQIDRYWSFIRFNFDPFMKAIGGKIKIFRRYIMSDFILFFIWDCKMAIIILFYVLTGEAFPLI